jgi:hypothetical protein
VVLVLIVDFVASGLLQIIVPLCIIDSVLVRGVDSMHVVDCGFTVDIVFAVCNISAHGFIIWCR